LAVAPLTLTVSDGEFQLNQATGASRLNWSTLGVTPESLQLPQLGVTAGTELHVAGKATVELPGFFTASGTGSLDVGEVTDAAGSPQFTSAHAIALTLDTSVAAGGVGAAGGSLKLVSITQGTTSSWLGVDASGITLSLSVAPLTLTVSDGEFQLNQA